MRTIRTLLTQSIALIMTILASSVYGQTETPEIKVTDLNRLEISEGISLHIISPEPIQFVDLSTNNLIGDLPAENIARVKLSDSIKNKNKLGIITVVGQSFMAQYRLEYIPYVQDAISNIQIQPENMQPLDYPKTTFSNSQLRRFALDIIREMKPRKPIRTAKNLKLKMELNNVYVVDDYIFLDITVENGTNLSYAIDGIKFSIEDKKIYKATNNQAIDLEPVYNLYKGQAQFKKSFRNIYVFKKFTYPNSKVLKIRLIEEQISGRTVEMDVKYSDVLNADTF